MATYIRRNLFIHYFSNKKASMLLIIFEFLIRIIDFVKVLQKNDLRILLRKLEIWLKCRLRLRNTCNFSDFWNNIISDKQNWYNEDEWNKCYIFIWKILFVFKRKDYFHFWCWDRFKINIFYFLQKGSFLIFLKLKFFDFN